MDAELDLLVDAARAGGGWAFGRLWAELSPTVTGYLRARGVAEPDDVTSDVFLAAFAQVGRFEGDGRAFRSWLFTIAHHKAVDSHRRGWSLREVPADVVDDGRWDGSAEDQALDRLATSGVRAVIGTLSPDQRDVLLLRVVADLSLAEVAEVLGKPLGAVKSLQHRGLARLRTRLAEPVSPAAVPAIARAR